MLGHVSQMRGACLSKSATMCIRGMGSGTAGVTHLSESLPALPYATCSMSSCYAVDAVVDRDRVGEQAPEM